MSIVKSKTNSYGPATLDIQLEQGADFVLYMELQRSSLPIDLTSATVTAHMSTAWAPGAQCIDLVVTVVGAPTLGTISIAFPDSLSFEALPSPPRKLVAPRVFQLGGWVLQIDEGGVITRLIDGNVQLDRDPCLT